MQLQGKKYINLVDHLFEDLELWYPVLRLQEEGATMDVVGPQQHETYKGKNGLTIRADHGYAQISPEEYDGVLIPGGWAPDKLRRSEHVLSIVRKMNEANKPIGLICHAAWVPISAGILKDRRITSTPGIQDDVTNAGAEWVDESAVVDGNIISSRRPPDLPDYMKAFIEAVSEHHLV